jgi:hypothetical protein
MYFDANLLVVMSSTMGALIERENEVPTSHKPSASVVVVSFTGTPPSSMIMPPVYGMQR